MTKILLIEDETPLREEILELLDAEGFDTIGAADGLKGVELAQTEDPDLILCDVLMPHLDGYSVLARLRHQPSTALIPFIFLTAKGTAADFRQGLKLGADDYITKPFERSDLLAAIATRLDKYAIVRQQQQQIERLQESNLLKDDFLSVASHELRSPMTNMMMAIQLLQRNFDQEQQQRYIEILQTECSREIDLINDLLDLQRLEALSDPPQLQRINLIGWITVITDLFSTRAQERQQTLSFTAPDKLPSLLLDPQTLHRILSELLNNACKYTPPAGSIRLEIYPPSLSNEWGSNEWGPSLPAVITFIVSNQAEIPSADLPKLFERFYRVPEGDRWHQGGSGLGLTLVKKLVETLNGSIQVTSTAGWTRFIVQIPTQSADLN